MEGRHARSQRDPTLAILPDPVKCPQRRSCLWPHTSQTRSQHPSLHHLNTPDLSKCHCKSFTNYNHHAPCTLTKHHFLQSLSSDILQSPPRPKHFRNPIHPSYWMSGCWLPQSLLCTSSRWIREQSCQSGKHRLSSRLRRWLWGRSSNHRW